MSNQAEMVASIKAAMANDSQEQPETIEAESTEVEETVDEIVETEETEEDTGAEVDTVDDPEGVEEDSQELTGSGDEDEFFYDIKGEEYSASEVESWKDNGLRQSDYTKKTQKLAEDRATFESDMKAQKAELQSTIDAVKDLVKVEGDWEVGEDGLPLYDEDMPKFQRAKAKQDKINKLLSDAGSKTAVTLSAEDGQALNTSLLEMFPTWSDATTRGKDLEDMSKYLTSIGFNDEFNNSVDPRMYRMMRDAAIGRKVSESGASIKKKVRKAPQIVKPKQAKKSAKLSQRQEAQERFRKSGGKDMKSGVEAIRHLM